MDGFSGPWQSADDRLGDTSFGIALDAMRSAKATWKEKGRDVRMRALLVEKRQDAYRELTKVPERYPEIDVRTYHGEFVPLVPTLLRDMPPGAFAFIFIDPKGWGIDIEALAPLLRWPNAEVLFNFMFDFINRAAAMSDPAIVGALDALIRVEGWRERLVAATAAPPRTVADARKEILVEAFSRTLAVVGGYEFVAETPIVRPLADRTLYSLIYATRRPPGIEVFRRAQIKTLREQESVRGEIRQSRDSGAQLEAFLPSEMTPSETEAYLASERAAAEAALLELAPTAASTLTYGRVWPRVLAEHAVTKAELNAISARLRKEGRLVFPEWPAGKRAPADEWHLYKVR